MSRRPDGRSTTDTEVKDERQGGHVEADRVGRVVRQRQRDPGDEHGQAAGYGERGGRTAGDPLGDGAGGDQQREDQQHAGDLHGLADGERHEQHEADPDGSHPDAAGLGDIFVQRGEQQRPEDGREHGEHDHAGADRDQDRAGGDPEYLPEQDGVGVLGVARVQADEQVAQAQRGGHDQADHHIPPAQPLAEHTHRPAGGEAEHRHPEHRAEPQQHRAGGAGEADVGDRVCGEA